MHNYFIFVGPPVIPVPPPPWALQQLYHNSIHHVKKGSQHAKNADMMMPRVRAAFRSRFILLLEAAGRKAPESGSVSTSTSFTASEVDRAPSALMPLICRCLFSSAAATLLLKTPENETLC